jgi:protein-disulfide isomerase
VARPNRARAPQRSSLNVFYVVLGIVAVIGVGVLVFQVFGSREPAAQPVAVEIDPVELARTPGVALGRADAPVVIYEFADFQCPGCAQFATFVAPLIKERLVEPGLVRYVYYDFPLSQHQHAFLASRAARCAGDQERFWEYHDLLYGRQPRWSSAASTGSATDLFVGYARELGLDRGAFEGCLRSNEHAEAVTRNLRFGESLGVSGTPSIFVNARRLQRIPSFQELEAMVRAEAGGAAPAPEGSPAAETEPEPAAQGAGG